jgi:lipopolysaccharide transport system permease protein
MTDAQAHPHEFVIRATDSISSRDFADAWNYRELLWVLALRDVRVRYKQASLGIAWAIFQPLTQMLIFTVLFNRFAGIKSGDSVPYSVFCLAGLTIWGLFSNGVSHSSESLLNSSNLITKVYFPRVLVPLATILTAVVDWSIASIMLLAFMLFKGSAPHATALLCIPIAGLAALAAAAIGLWLSALNVQFRDVRHALPFFIQIMVYATPVFYPPSLVPQRFHALLVINPMAAIVEGFRAALFGTTIPWGGLALAAVVSTVIGFTGFLRFRHLERTFADRI